MIRSSNQRAAAIADNQLLASWPSDIWAEVGPDLEPVELVQGQTLQEAGVTTKYVYFPTSAVVSLVSGMQDGGSAEVAVVGREGVVGAVPSWAAGLPSAAAMCRPPVGLGACERLRWPTTQRATRL